MHRVRWPPACRPAGNRAWRHLAAEAKLLLGVTVDRSPPSRERRIGTAGCMVGWLRGCTQIGRLCGTQPGALRAATRPGLGGLAYPRVQGLDDVGVFGGDRRTFEFHGGVISSPPGSQNTGKMANRSICSTRTAWCRPWRPHCVPRGGRPGRRARGRRCRAGRRSRRWCRGRARPAR